LGVVDQYGCGEDWRRALLGDGYEEEGADDDAGGWLVVSVLAVLILGLASWAVVRLAGRRGDRHASDHALTRPLAARCAAGAIGAAQRRRLAVLGDHDRRGLGARR
jgi:hypothetical protein